MIIIILVALILLNFLFTYSFEGFTLTQSSSEAIQNLSSIVNTQTLKVNTVESTDVKTSNVNAKNVVVDGNIEAKYANIKGNVDAVRFSGLFTGKVLASELDAPFLRASDYIRSGRSIAVSSPGERFTYEFRTNVNDWPHLYDPNDLQIGIYDKNMGAWGNLGLAITPDGRIIGRVFDKQLSGEEAGEIGGTTNIRDCRNKCIATHGDQVQAVARETNGGKCKCIQRPGGSHGHPGWQSQRIF